ncbi:MAG TPA: hypothetical protein VG538_04520 [Vicinamibacterales bacterium]|nr:hypothetical protein [Vicinamibacterales bacterium]
MMWSLLARSRFSRQFVVTAIATLACAVAIHVEPASAQLTLLNGVSAAPTAFVNLVDGVDAAYDSVNNVYLVVGARNHVTGVFVSPSGVPLSAPIAIKPQAAGSKPFGAMPHVKYSPQLGGFLVAWAVEETSGTDQIHVRTVKYPGTLGTENVITDSTAYLTVGGIAIGYSPTSQRFLVVYKTSPPNRLRAQLFDINGNKVGGSVQISNTFGDFPSITWNSNGDVFGVSYSGEDQHQEDVDHLNHFFSGFVRVPASNAAAFAATLFNQSASGRTAATSVEYNPSTGNYVMVWQEPQHAMVSEISASGTVLTMGTASTVVGRNSYDALSAALNPNSGTFLLVGLMGSGDDVGGAELNGHGVRTSSSDTGVMLSKSPLSPAEPARYTRATPNLDGAQWATVFNRNFGSVLTQEAATSTTGGGGSAAFAAYSAGSSSGSGGTSTPPPSSPPPSGPTCAGASRPVSSWVCVTDSTGTGWLPPDNPRTLKFLNGGSTPPPTNPPPQQSQSTPPPTTSCTTSKPVSSWICVNGGWLPPDHPLAIAYLASQGSQGSQGSTPPPSNPYAPCVTAPPGTGWVCTAQGNWLPPDNPNAIPAMPTCPASYGTAPGHGWIRVGDGWVPPDHPLAANGVCKAP